jgi:hypothetical protein
VTKHLLPSIPGAFLLLNVLSPDECDYVISNCTAMGYTPDHPTSAPAPTGIDSTEWLVTPNHQPGIDSITATSMATEGLLHQLQKRVLDHMPTLNGSEAVGINPRWRAFRYGEQGIYRPHVDGSWTCAGETPDGTYTNDVRSDRRSKLTFLMYLNDGFTGGETTFYIPSSSTTGGLIKKAVNPLRGAALVFPQGNIASLVHEGSQVLEGTKYVIRSDVIYADEAADK